MTPQHNLPPWSDPAWIAEVSDWIEVETTRLGTPIKGSLKQIHERPWSTVFQVPTTDATLIFKASADIPPYEVGLTETLANLYPNDVLQVFAVDLERGWMLMAEGGIRLREILRTERDMGHWEKLLPQYAQLQMALANHVDEVRALGVPDRSLSRLPVLYESLLKDEGSLLIGLPGGLSHEEHHRLLDRIPQVELICEQLAAAPFPDSIHHGDLHDGNIFLSSHGYLFFDWGDASISHPFFSLRTAAVSLEYSLGWEEDSPAFHPLRDIYLEAWGKFGSTAVALEAFKLAKCLSPICSALSWHRGVTSLHPSLRKQYEVAIPSLLQEYLAEVEKATA